MPVARVLLKLLFLALLAAACEPDVPVPPLPARDPLQQGMEAHRAGRLDEAAGFYRAALIADPQDKFALGNLGLVEQTQGRPAAAETYYRMALQADPGFPMALFNLGLVRSELGDTDEAIQLFRRLLVIQPDDGRARYNLALALARAGRQAEADAEFQEARRLDPSLPVPTAGPRP